MAHEGFRGDAARIGSDPASLAREAFARLAAARNRVRALNCQHAPADAVMDKAVHEQYVAENLAIEMIRRAVPGPESPGERGREYRGNRAIVVDDQLFV